MTEFETKVAEALTAALNANGSGEVYESENEIEVTLAPRVAAAIEAARHPAKMWQEGDNAPQFATAREAEDFAIFAALRGET